MSKFIVPAKVSYQDLFNAIIPYKDRHGINHRGRCECQHCVYERDTLLHMLNQKQKDVLTDYWKNTCPDRPSRETVCSGNKKDGFKLYVKHPKKVLPVDLPEEEPKPESDTPEEQPENLVTKRTEGPLGPDCQCDFEGIDPNQIVETGQVQDIVPLEVLEDLSRKLNVPLDLLKNGAFIRLNQVSGNVPPDFNKQSPKTKDSIENFLGDLFSGNDDEDNDEGTDNSKVKA